MARLEKYIKNNESTIVTGIAVGTISLLFLSFFNQYFKLLKSCNRNEELENRMKEFLRENGINDLDFKIYMIRNADNANVSCIGDIIVVPDALFEEDFSDDEICAILLHEYAHYKNHDTLLNACQTCIFILLAVEASLLSNNVFGAVMLYFIVSNLGRMFENFIRRRREIKSDEMVVKLGYAQELIRALSKYDDKIKSTNNGWLFKIATNISNIIGTHPPLKKRIKKILINMNKLPLNGDIINNIKELDQIVNGDKR